MPSDSTKILNSIDLAKVTIDDLARMPDSVLRRALLSAINQSIAADDGATHTNHWAFGSHMKTVAIEMVNPAFNAPRVRNP